MRSLVAILLLLAVSERSLAQPHEIIWDREGTEQHSHFGGQLFPLGDQNSDGFADWGVWSTGTPSRADFFHGGNPPSMDPYLTYIAPDSVTTWYSTFSCGDLNSDNQTDWASTLVYSGRYDVDIFFGTSDLVPDKKITTTNFTVRNYGRRFDFNGDNFDDLFLYSFNQDIGRVYYGGNPMDTLPDWELHSPPETVAQAFPWSFGDLNNDGFDDFVSADLNIPAVWIFTGSEQPDTIPRVTLDVEAYSWSIDNDVNADGYDDLILLDQGVWTVYLGNANLDLTPSFEFDVPGCYSLPQVYHAGDFNDDGYGDFMIIDDGCNQGWGIFYMMWGTHWHAIDHAFTILGRGLFYLVGIVHALGPGDINGDGIDDILISATNNDDEGTRGRVIALAGDTNYVVSADGTPPVTPQDMNITVYPNPFNAQASIEFDIPIGTTKVDLSIYNTLGQQVHHEHFPVLSNHIRYFLNASNWSTGIYFLTVDTGLMQSSKKLVVLK